MICSCWSPQWSLLHDSSHSILQMQRDMDHAMTTCTCCKHTTAASCNTSCHAHWHSLQCPSCRTINLSLTVTPMCLVKTATKTLNNCMMQPTPFAVHFRELLQIDLDAERMDVHHTAEALLKRLHKHLRRDAGVRSLLHKSAANRLPLKPAAWAQHQNTCMCA